MVTTCPQCKSTTAISGIIPGADGNTTNGFQPIKTKFVFKLLFRKVRLTEGERFYGCPECGLVWAYTNPRDLVSFIATKLKDEN